MRPAPVWVARMQMLPRNGPPELECTISVMPVVSLRLGKPMVAWGYRICKQALLAAVKMCFSSPTVPIGKTYSSRWMSFAELDVEWDDLMVFGWYDRMNGVHQLSAMFTQGSFSPFARIFECRRPAHLLTKVLRPIPLQCYRIEKVLNCL